MSIDNNKLTVQRAFEALMAGDLRPLGDLLAPNAVLHQCGFLEPIPGRAILQGEFPGRGPVLDRRVRLERMIGEGDIVALHGWTTGRYSDPDSPEKDGKHVSFPSMSIIRLENGLIAEIWNIQDISTLQTQPTAYLAGHQYEKAQRVIDAGLALAPNDAQLIESRGDVRAGTGDPDSALADWRRSLELNSEQLSSVYSSAFLLEREGRLEEAMDAWRYIIDWSDARGYSLDTVRPKQKLERLHGETANAAGEAPAR